MKEFGDYLGISKQAIQNGLKNGIPCGWIVKVCMEYGVSPNLVITGDPGIPIREDAHSAPNDVYLKLNIIPPNTSSKESSVTFPAAWLPGCNSFDKLGFYIMNDQAMAPLIREGEGVVLDLKQNDPTRIVDGKIYLFMEQNVFKLRKLVSMNEILMVTSLNNDLFPAYQYHFKSINIIGRVLWSGGQLS
ncbi:MAG: hypothetical protein OEV64_06185 [Desulfobulbaceae bacterium]|nr:hypothetical protein [Desulfobulbaceae bacterium]